MYKELMNYLLNINHYEARNYILKKKDVVNVIEELIIPSLNEIGDGWQQGIYSLSQVFMSSVICESISEELYINSDKNLAQKVNIAIVTFDDYHTFGKKLVALTLKSAGYQFDDLGMIFDEDELLNLVKEKETQILLLSVLMLPPALKIKELKIKLLEINPNMKIIVGGAPFRFDKELYKKIGADACGDTPKDAIRLIQEMEAQL